MFETIKIFWRQRSPKDQIYLVIGAVVTGLFLLWIVLCKPLIDWRDQERQRLENLTGNLNKVESLVGQLQQQQHSTTSRNGSLADIVDASLRDNQLRMKGFQPGRNDEVRLDLENAAYKPLIQWLYDLEHQHNIQILELHLAQTQTAGVLKASLRLKSL